MADDAARRELEARHENEEQELEEKISAHLADVKASAGKGKKAKAALEAAEREIDQWRYEMQERHQDELRAAGAGGEADESREAAEQAAEKTPAPAADPAEEEAERIRRKKEKASRKKQGRADREAEREEELERERRAAGPSRRATELAAISKQLAAHDPPLQVSEVPGDGNCLYRAVADQIRRYRPELHAWTQEKDQAYQEMRAICAATLRRRREDYEPFAELGDGEDFEGYCRRVENSADWGGHLELRALADALHARITVHRAEGGELQLGEGAGEPLRVTYHEAWLALGEHYNSAVRKE